MRAAPPLGQSMLWGCFIWCSALECDYKATLLGLEMIPVRYSVRTGEVYPGENTGKGVWGWGADMISFYRTEGFPYGKGQRQFYAIGAN